MIMSYRRKLLIPLNEGDRLDGGFIIERYIDKGTFGHVYLAHTDLRKSFEVAIKVVLIESELNAAQLEHEFKVMDRIRHDNVLRVYLPVHATFNDQKLLLLPMEYAEGGNLGGWLYNNDVIGRKEQALEYFRQVCTGVSAIHAEGLAHLDLKPGNLLFKDGIIKVADFGLSRNLKTGSNASPILKRDGVGTHYYMAPEQTLSANTETDVDRRADIYALGCILFEMLKGNPPYSGTKEEIYFKIKHEVLPNVDDLEPYLQTIILKCLCKAPKDRFQNIKELIDVLDVGEGIRRTVEQPATSVKPPIKPRKTYSWRMITGAIIIFAVAASAYFRPDIIKNVVSRISALASPLQNPFKDSTTGMEFVPVKGGCFQMGDTFGGGGDNDEKPVHDVCVSDFAMGKYEVTVGQFRRFVEANGYKTDAEKGDGCRIWTGSAWKFKSDSSWKNPGYSQEESHPVTCVSWNDATAFATWLTGTGGRQYQLPTEAEWEYAARSGGKGENYAGGDNVDAVAWYSGNSGLKAHPVGQKQANSLGIYDMSGNVWEWVQDWKGGYSSDRKQDAQGPSTGTYRVNRGGSWGRDARDVRAANRGDDLPNRSYSTLGFRLASPVQ
jgi:formylglycine-generating enzyme required for sulfatase activity